MSDEKRVIHWSQYTEMVFCDEFPDGDCGGDHGEPAWSNVHALADEAIRLQRPLPATCQGSHAIGHPKLDALAIMEQALDDTHHESAIEVYDTDGLQKLLDAWIATQPDPGTRWPDDDTVIDLAGLEQATRERRAGR